MFKIKKTYSYVLQNIFLCSLEHERICSLEHLHLCSSERPHGRLSNRSWVLAALLQR